VGRPESRSHDTVSWHTGCTVAGVIVDEMGSDRRVVASSWRDLDDLLLEGSWNPRLARYRSPFAFRGDSRCNRGLQTGLVRLGGDTGAKERHLIRNFRKYARRSFVGDDSVWNWLALAQHHGLPTRLLDWTYSPYVALHFVTATPQAMDVAGEVWMMNVKRVHEELPGPLRALLRAEGSDVFTGEMLSKVTDSVDGLVELAEKPFALFLEPPSLDDRIINQAALFSLMSTDEAQLGEWLEERPEAVRRVVIPAALKWEVRDRLDQINLTERVLFPGLDGLSEWLARYYRER
jgi:hypothetical protein